MIISASVAIRRQMLKTMASEATLRRKEAYLRAIFDNCPVPFCLNDTSGNITFLNRAFQKTFGYTVEDIPTL